MWNSLHIFLNLRSIIFDFKQYKVRREQIMEEESKMGQEVTTESRRKFLKTAGKFAVYTPPALMLMSNASATYVKDSNGVVKKHYKHHKHDYKHKYVGRSKYRRYRRYKSAKSNGAKRRIRFKWW